MEEYDQEIKLNREDMTMTENYTIDEVRHKYKRILDFESTV